MTSSDRAGPDARRLLYEDNDGTVIGLDEVQLLDPVPEDRIPAVRTLLASPDPRVVFEAAIVLAAWGDDAGIKRVEEMIDRRIDLDVTLSPHRIHGYDNVYDEIAQAVRAYGLSGGDASVRERLYRKLLYLYGPLRFESRLKGALLREEGLKDGLYSEVIAAIERALALGEPYLASQLLPVAAKWAPSEAPRLIALFSACPAQTPDPAANVAEALEYAGSETSVRVCR